MEANGKYKMRLLKCYSCTWHHQSVIGEQLNMEAALESCHPDDLHKHSQSCSPWKQHLPSHQTLWSQQWGQICLPPAFLELAPVVGVYLAFQHRVDPLVQQFFFVPKLSSKRRKKIFFCFYNKQSNLFQLCTCNRWIGISNLILLKFCVVMNKYKI